MPAVAAWRSIWWSIARRPPRSRESRDRSVLARRLAKTRDSTFPRAGLRSTLAPADLPEESGRFDLPIALGILARHRADSGGCLSGATSSAGELALTGAIFEPIRGARWR